MRDLCEWCIIILNISNASWCNFDLQSQDRRIDPRSMLPASSISVSMGVKDEQYGSAFSGCRTKTKRWKTHWAQMKCRVGYEIITVAERRNTIGYSCRSARLAPLLPNEWAPRNPQKQLHKGRRTASRKERDGRAKWYVPLYLGAHGDRPAWFDQGVHSILWLILWWFISFYSPAVSLSSALTHTHAAWSLFPVLCLRSSLCSLVLTFLSSGLLHFFGWMVTFVGLFFCRHAAPVQMKDK